MSESTAVARGEGFVAGMRASLAISASAIPFGMAVGAIAVDGGMSVAEAAAMSIVVFAGAAQLAMLQLSTTDAPALLLIAIAAGINLRFVMYGVVLAPTLRQASPARRIGLAYLLTDQAFAICTARFAREPAPGRPIAYYVGTALSLWIAWQLGTVLGAALGRTLPPSLAIDFAAPLAFVALGAMAIRDRADLFAAIAAVAVVLAAQALPFGLSILPAIAVGVVVGRLTGGQR